jgi:hypothetical protein
MDSPRFSKSAVGRATVDKESFSALTSSSSGRKVIAHKMGNQI